MRASGKIITGIALIAVCGGAPVAALEPYLVKDINDVPNGAGSSPYGFAGVNGVAVFSAFDADRRIDLWRSDGTTAGTFQLTEVCQSDCPEAASPLMRAGGHVLFSVRKGFHSQLWATDGTGTDLLVNGLEASGLGNVRKSAFLGGRLFFAASDDAHGDELWVTDGTQAGTRLAGDVFPGPNGSSPSEPVAFGGRVFFLASVDLSGMSLWSTDGTPEGTHRIPGPWVGNMHGLEAVGGRLVFVAEAPGLGIELWQSDGTAAHTSLVADLSPGGGSTSISPPRVIGNRYYFIATRDRRERTEGQELWVTDGTSRGTRQLTTFREPNAFFVSTHELPLTGPALGAKLVFRADDGRHGVEPWITDGTAKGTRLLKDICPGLCSGDGEPLLAVGARLLLRGKDGRGDELWATDGPEKGTAIVADLCPGGCDAAPQPFAVLGPSAIVAANDAQGRQLWATDGTSGGTRQLTHLEGAQLRSGALENGSGVVGNLLFFAGSVAAFGDEPWRTDGTSQGTYLVRDIAAGDSGGSFPGAFQAAGSTVFFIATDGINGYGLWRSDGSESGTFAVDDHVPTGDNDHRSLYFNAASLAGSLYFESIWGGGANGALWRSDGTKAGTAPLMPGGFWIPERKTVAATSTLVFFQGFDAIYGHGLWTTDGTTGGTRAVAAGALQFPEQITPVGQHVFFTAWSAGAGYELWQSDGTDKGTHMAADLTAGPEDSQLAAFTAMGEKLLFVRQSSGDLWISDGTPGGTKRLADVGWNNLGMNAPIAVLGSRALMFTGTGLWITDGTAANTAHIAVADTGGLSIDPVAYQGNVYFAKRRTDQSVELWRSDGTAAGTTQVLDAAGHAILWPQVLRELAGKLAFIAGDGSDMALWVSDGTAAGTAPVTVVQHGSIDPTVTWELIRAGDRLFFPAYDPRTGWELWALRP
jgi:ELWxxDGT repeat protein